MQGVFYVLVFILVLTGGFVLFFQTNKTVTEDVKLYKQKPLMTANEIEFFSRLTQALPEYHIFPQVSLGALLQPNVPRNDKKYHSLRGTFSQKIVDYVVSDKQLKIIAIIELDDKTHDAEKDSKRDSMLTQAGLRTIRFQSKNKPTIEQIQTIFNSKLAN